MRKKLLAIMLLASIYGFAQQQVKFTKQSSSFATRSEVSSVQKAMEFGENQMIIGYCPNEVNPDGGVGGVNQQVEMAAAVYFPVEKMKLLTGNKLLKINLAIMDTKVKNVKVWIRSTLNGTNKMVQSISNITKGWNEVTLETPYELDGSDIYVGYTLTAPASTYPIGFSGGADQSNAMFLAINKAWSNYYGMKFGSLSLQCLLEGEKKIENDVTLIANPIGNHYAKPDEESTVTYQASIFNATVNSVSNFEVTYQAGTGEKVSKTIEKAIAPFATIDFEQTIQVPNSPGNQDINFSITKVNGKEDECPFDNTLADWLYIYTESFPRRVLVEQFTTQQCGYCPTGLKTLNMALEGKEFSWVAHHVGFYDDDFTIDESVEYLDLYGGGTYAPACMFDRTVVPGATSPVFGLSYQSVSGGAKVVKSYWDYVSEIPTFITVDVNATYNNDTRTLDISVSGQAQQAALARTNPKLTIFLTESGLSGKQSGATGTIEHNHVIRAVLTDVWGSEPEWSSDKNQYTYHTTYKIPSTQKVENMTIVAFICNQDENDINNRMIMNSGEMQLSSLTGIETISKENNNIAIFAENGMIKVDGQYDNLRVFTPTGIVIDNTNLAPGLYVVKLEIDKQTVVKKIIVK